MVNELKAKFSLSDLLKVTVGLKLIVNFIEKFRRRIIKKTIGVSSYLSGKGYLPKLRFSYTARSLMQQRMLHTVSAEHFDNR